MVRIEVAARLATVITRAADGLGVDRAALCAAAAFDPASAADPDARIPLSVETALWDEAARLGGDEAFGLHTAETVQRGAFGVFDFVVRTAPTPRVLFDRLARYNRLTHDAAVFSVVERGEVTILEHRLDVPGATQSRHAAEFTLAAILQVGTQLAGMRLAPRAVRFRHPAPASTAEHARIFGVLPSFNAAANALELDTAEVARPCPASDPALSEVIERYAETLLAAQPAPAEGTASRVRRRLANELATGEPSLSHVAGALRMSERSLQRRLAAEGVTFDAILDDLRRELALRYLADDRIAIAEVAYLLGYSEPSPFHRAVKRWTGATPRAARSRALSRSDPGEVQPERE